MRCRGCVLARCSAIACVALCDCARGAFARALPCIAVHCGVCVLVQRVLVQRVAEVAEVAGAAEVAISATSAL
eukprot:10710149-Alexandrium_andersonii.AAC.1